MSWIVLRLAFKLSGDSWQTSTGRVLNYMYVSSHDR